MSPGSAKNGKLLSQPAIDKLAAEKAAKDKDEAERIAKEKAAAEKNAKKIAAEKADILLLYSLPPH